MEAEVSMRVDTYQPYPLDSMYIWVRLSSSTPNPMDEQPTCKLTPTRSSNGVVQLQVTVDIT